MRIGELRVSLYKERGEGVRERLEVDFLLEELLGIPREKFYAFPEIEVKKEKASLLFEGVRKIRRGYPLPYLIKKSNFYGLDFFLEEGVFIPRPETEILVDTALKIIGGKRVRVLEAGSGAGNISITLARFSPAQVLGVEISEQAVEVSLYNAKRWSVEGKATFIHKDMREIFSERVFKEDFDLIVSNPPYVARKEIPFLSPSVFWEPVQTWYGGEEGMDYYCLLVREGRKALKKGGYLVMEMGKGKAFKVRKLLRENGFTEIGIIKDYQGVDRVIWGRKEVR